MIPPRGKISGAYASSALIKTDASRAGADEALALTQDGHLTKGGTMNIFMLRDGLLITQPVTDNILEGITRRTVIELAQKEMGLTVVERQINRSEVYICEELFLTGTAAQVTAVTRVDFRPVGPGVMGAVAGEMRRLSSLKRFRGELPGIFPLERAGLLKSDHNQINPVVGSEKRLLV